MMTIILLLALASSPPTVDIHSVCRDAQWTASPEDPSTVYASCLRDEQDAMEQLRKNWASYSSDALEACAEDNASSFSYVEMLTCMELQPGGSLTAGMGEPRVSTRR
jgi:hypothetical protein